MSEEKNSNGGLGGIIWILVGFGLIWLFLGGPGRMAEKRGIFIKPPAPIDTGETYGEISFWDSFRKKRAVPPSDLSEEEKLAWELKQAEEEAKEIKVALEKLEKEEKISPFAEKAEIRRCLGRRTDVDEEYIELKINASIGERILISDWSLKSAMTGTKIKIGEASKLPYSSRVNKESPVFASGGDKIIISSGRSPIGASFQINKCSGYLEQFQDFEPRIDKKCPLVEDENLPFAGPNAFDDECWDYIESLSRCETPLEFPLDMQHECRVYLTTEVNYNACVDNYKNDSDFYRSEWRIFLDRGVELWKKEREIIELLDAQDKLIDVYTY